MNQSLPAGHEREHLHGDSLGEDLSTISVIIPVHNGGEKFIKCLESIAVSDPAPYEVIVVADGESDGSWRAAEKYNVKIVSLAQSAGPAKARNMGAQIAKGSILFFIDADVTVSPDVFGVVVDFFDDNPKISAVVGSYDDEPAETNFLSQYKNLFHHYTHQQANSEMSTFWTACGAVRAQVFSQMNGFDEKRYRPSGGACPGTIEDVEFGYRMIEAGHLIRMLKGLQVKHLKRWECIPLLKTEIFYRALPWTELLMGQGRLVNTLNIDISNRLSIILVFCLLFTVPASLSGFPVLPAALTIAFFLVSINLRCYLFFAKKRGIVFSALVIPWHWFYFLYSGGSFIIGNVLFRPFVQKILGKGKK